MKKNAYSDVTPVPVINKNQLIEVEDEELLSVEEFIKELETEHKEAFSKFINVLFNKEQ